jgi:hypothetical protein
MLEIFDREVLLTKHSEIPDELVGIRSCKDLGKLKTLCELATNNRSRVKVLVGLEGAVVGHGLNILADDVGVGSRSTEVEDTGRAGL